MVCLIHVSLKLAVCKPNLKLGLRAETVGLQPWQFRPNIKLLLYFSR